MHTIVIRMFPKVEGNNVEMIPAMIIAKYCILEIGGVVW